MAIRVACPKCNQTLEAPDEFAGRVAICPACRTKVQIPGAPAIVGPAPVPSAQGPEARPRPTRPIERIESMVSDVRAEMRAINRKLGCLIAIVVVIAIAGCVAAATMLRGASVLY